jgi:uncharacterized protein YdhG (YjbR/CyaY superfamily)
MVMQRRDGERKPRLTWLSSAACYDSKDYDTSKGTIRFQPDEPLPAALVRKVVKARIAENAE